MEHNLLIRYRDYLRRRYELLRLQVNLKNNPTESRRRREALLSEAFTKLHQNVMAAIYDRTRYHAQRYKLVPLVMRFQQVNRKRRAYQDLRTRAGKNPANERIKIRLDDSYAELDTLEQELMAEAIKVIDRIIDLESRNE